MKNRVVIIVILFFILFSASLKAADDFSFGISLRIGGRFDNLRMCVASPAGSKGGPLADIMLNFKFKVTDTFNLTVYIPVFRPVLFGIAFKMLQFEPELGFEFKKHIKDNTYFVYGFGLGMSFHYGPDYTSDKKDRGESFFAVGPFFSSLLAFQFQAIADKDTIIGIRPFYVPLFAKNRKPGTVIGGVLEGQTYF